MRKAEACHSSELLVPTRNADLLRALRPGILAGLVGALLLNVYRLGLAYLAHGALPEDHYRTVAAALIGSSAFALPGAAYLGVLIHFVIGATWGVGFAVAFLHSAEIQRRPIFSGAFFGILVYVATRLMAFAAGVAEQQQPRAIYVDLIAHTIFFGVPVALIVSARLRAA